MTAISVLTELLRLYDLRFEIAKREKEEWARSSEYRAETRRQLRQYGAEKKVAWEAARAILSENK